MLWLFLIANDNIWKMNMNLCLISIFCFFSTSGVYPTPFNLFKMIFPELKTQFQEKVQSYMQKKCMYMFTKELKVAQVWDFRLLGFSWFVHHKVSLRCVFGVKIKFFYYKYLGVRLGPRNSYTYTQSKRVHQKLNDA